MIRGKSPHPNETISSFSLLSDGWQIFIFLQGEPVESEVINGWCIGANIVLLRCSTLLGTCNRSLLEFMCWVVRWNAMRTT